MWRVVKKRVVAHIIKNVFSTLVFEHCRFPLLIQSIIVVLGFQHALESSNVIDEDVADVPHLDDHEDQQGIANYGKNLNFYQISSPKHLFYYV